LHVLSACSWYREDMPSSRWQCTQCSAAVATLGSAPSTHACPPVIVLVQLCELCQRAEACRGRSDAPPAAAAEAAPTHGRTATSSSGAGRAL
jgi:hypothetical protein